jgi:predicted kinase
MKKALNINTENTIVFMMGAAGAGKSTIIANSSLSTLPVVDCDKHKERHPDYDPKAPQLLHDWSKQEAKREMYARLGNSESFIIDGTGRDASRMIKDIQAVQGLGYRAVVVYVEVTLQTSLERNARRTRTVPEMVVREQHELIPVSYQLVSRYADEMITVNND